MDNPRISVVIPVYNDPEGISTTLRSLFRQSMPNETYELIVVDNNSTDQTPEVIDSLLDSFDGTAQLLFETEVQSSYAARNRGIQKTRGNLITFIDADMTVEEDWLERVQAYISTEDVDYLGCDVKVTLEEETIAGRFDQQILGFSVASSLLEQHFVPTACLVVRKEVIQNVGEFDDRLFSGGDQEFGDRVHRKGFRTTIASEIIMFHPARDTVSSLVKKFFRTGRGAFLLSYFYPDRFPSKKRNVFDVRHFLPVRPTAFRSLMKEKDLYDSNRTLFFLFYILCWLRKTVRHAGYLFEFLRKQCFL